MSTDRQGAFNGLPAFVCCTVCCKAGHGAFHMAVPACVKTRRYCTACCSHCVLQGRFDLPVFLGGASLCVATGTAHVPHTAAAADASAGVTGRFSCV